MEMASRLCPLCRSDARSELFAEERIDPALCGEFAFASRKIPEYMHHRLLRCRDCDVLYANPVLKLETLADAYRSAAYDSSKEALYAARTYARLLRRIVGRLPGRESALDIGAGDGAFLRELLACGFRNVVGVEPSAAPIAEAEDDVRPLIQQGMFAARNFPDQRFQLITCFQTLEHVSEPLDLCREAWSLLCEGGALLCVVHNRRAWSARALGLHSPIYDIEHLQLFSPASARRLLEASGFSDVVCKVVVNHYPLNYWLKLFPMPIKIKKRLMAAGEALWIGRMPLLLPAGNIAVVGFKPTA